MILISSSGGSGSSFLATQLKRLQPLPVIIRPDAGYQKIDKSAFQIAKERMSKIINIPKDFYTPQALWRHILDKVAHREVIILSMTWGGLGFFDDIPYDVIWMVRHPVHAFNSFSGGGWRDEGGKRRIAGIGAKDVNDRKWIDAFLYDFSHWISQTASAVQHCKRENGYILRYHRFEEDWQKTPLSNVNVSKAYRNKDDWNKPRQYLSRGTIDYIMDKTGDLWKEVEAL